MTPVCCGELVHDQTDLECGAMMTRVIPYEHKGATLRQLRVQSASDAMRVYSMFHIEQDRWLRKLLAQRLLEYAGIDELTVDIESLVAATQCQIEP